MKREEQLALKKADYEGKVYPSNRFGDVEIVEYINSKRAIIRFINTGYTVEENWSAIKSGHIRDSSLPTTCGVGICDIYTKESGKDDKEYRLWCGILERCYCEKFHAKKPTYIGCTIHDDWKYLSNFKAWCNRQIGFNAVNDKGKPFELDKDILIKGNKVYSEDTCVFVPPEINTLILKADRIRGKYPIGVCEDKQAGKFIVRISVEGKLKYIGRYYCEKEAFYAYKVAKEAYIKEVAEKWKDKINPRVYDALMKWEINIDD